MSQRMVVLPQVQQLADEMGDFIVFWGFKKVHGRIWTHLIVSNVPLDASDLIKRLHISKALVSMSLSEMLALHVIEEVGKSSRGTQVYQANPQILSVLLSILSLREREMLSRIRKATKTLTRVNFENKTKRDELRKHKRAQRPGRRGCRRPRFVFEKSSI